MKIVLDDWINIAKVRENRKQRCSFCRGKMREGEHAVSIRKEVKGSGQMYNIWIHLRCVSDFVKSLKQGVKENEEKILIEEI